MQTFWCEYDLIYFQSKTRRTQPGMRLVFASAKQIAYGDWFLYCSCLIFWYEIWWPINSITSRNYFLHCIHDARQQNVMKLTSICRCLLITLHFPSIQNQMKNSNCVQQFSHLSFHVNWWHHVALKMPNLGGFIWENCLVIAAHA